MNGRPFSVHPVTDYWRRCAVWQVVGESKRSPARVAKAPRRRSLSFGEASRSSGYPFRISDVLVGEFPKPPTARSAFSRTCLAARLFRFRWSLIPAHPRGKIRARSAPESRRSRRVISQMPCHNNLRTFFLSVRVHGNGFRPHGGRIPVDLIRGILLNRISPHIVQVMQVQ